MMKPSVRLLLRVAVAEAVSFLLLLGVAMPLKYIWHLPVAVRIGGSLHGMLFLAFCWCLMQAASECRWPLPRTALVFAASLIPFAPFFLDRRLRAWEDGGNG